MHETCYEKHLVWKGHRITTTIVSLSVIYWILLVAGDKRHITVLVWPELCLWRDRRIRNLARLAAVCRGRDKCYRYSASPLRHLHHTTPWPSLQRILILPGCNYCMHTWEVRFSKPIPSFELFFGIIKEMEMDLFWLMEIVFNQTCDPMFEEISINGEFLFKTWRSLNKMLK